MPRIAAIGRRRRLGVHTSLGLRPEGRESRTRGGDEAMRINEAISKNAYSALSRELPMAP